jgi:N4-gp56 family major capsid protein
MTTQNYSTVASRNLIYAAQEMLTHAEFPMVLGNFGAQKEMPKNKTDTIVFRRVDPFAKASNGVATISASDFITSEGNTPNSNTITYTDVSATMQQYAVLFKFSSKAAMLYEDDIPGDMQKITGETLGEVSELICYGVVKGGTNVVYANGSTRAGLNTPISLNKLRQAALTLEANAGKPVTKRLSTGPDFNSTPVEGGYIVFVHTDAVSDVRNLAGFKHVVEYAQYKPIHPNEFGSVEDFRFIKSRLFKPFLAAGSATLSPATGTVFAADSTNADVYPFICCAEDAWGHVALKGMGAISPTLIPASVKNHANPSGMFGYVGADFWTAKVRLNENWMVRIEAARLAL